ncbi:hypothetical protein ACLQ3C_16530 [Gordonia sp. DT30]|uniref:hypothetical protein n=1 Tax=unclassified Gordonia (in: high G+C Gram-positive bacteria) TaxID=2657482 RepID=UPI003CEED510
MTSAFLASEQALSDIDSAVQTAHDLDSRSRLRDEWTAVRERYAEVTAEYLRLSAAVNSGAPAADGAGPRPDELLQCTDSLTSMTEEMNRFAQTHARELDRARHSVTELGVLEQRARVAATESTAALEQAPASLLGLRTVARAADELRDAAVAFERAEGIRGRKSAATAVLAAAEHVGTALTDAPGFADRAARVIRSVDTRRSAIGTRQGQVPDQLSALRREFSADCSQDLQNSDTVIRDHLRAADAHLEKSRAVVRGMPDQAIDEAEAARDDLDAAEQAVDAVGDRLRLLRDVQADPAATEQRVRFRLRDAQHFAVNNSLVDEWGSVLDAQAERISRARGALDRVHPDYWSYLTQLRAVDQRVIEIVDRMRGQVGAR